MPQLAQTHLCTGCTACASACPNSCITMTADKNGFLQPEIHAETCVECGLCEKTCPVLHPPFLPDSPPDAYAAYSRDESMRLESSSGGVFSEIARAVLRQGGAVYGAAYDNDFRVVHICAEDEDTLSRLRGAKYAQSDLTDSFRSVKNRLETGQTVLFAGTPCQIAGLKAYLRRDYPNLLCVDFVCYSAPSPLAWKEYILFRAKEDAQGTFPERINLRSKISGWSRYQYSNVFSYPDGTQHACRSGDSLYMKLFVGGYISRESCTNCSFKGFSRVSDITLGDFWGIWDVVPEMDDNKGTSLVILHTEKGRQLFHSLASCIVSQEVSLDACAAQNSAILRPAQPSPKREQTLSMIRANRIGELSALFSKPKPSKASLPRRILRKLKSL